MEVDQGEALLTILLLSNSFHHLSGGAGDTAGLHLEACQGFRWALDPSGVLQLHEVLQQSCCCSLRSGVTAETNRVQRVVSLGLLPSSFGWKGQAAPWFRCSPGKGTPPAEMAPGQGASTGPG